MTLGPAELQLLTSMTQLLSTVVLPPDPHSCGLRHERGIPGLCEPDDPQLRDRLTPGNASVAWFAEFPWIASLRGESPSRPGSPLPVCGAALVHPQVVLASAACHEEAINRGFKITVRLADYRVNTDLDFGRPASDFTVRKAVYHPQYLRQGPSVRNDVALLILDQPVPLSDDIAPVCLPWFSDNAETLAKQWEAGECVLAGWSDPRKDAIDAVLYQRVQFMSRGTCQPLLVKLDRLSPFQDLHDGFACGTAESDCWADVGTPLACRSSRDPARWVLAGVVPWARLHEPCNEVVTYTNIGYFSNWIETAIAADLSVMS